MAEPSHTTAFPRQPDPPSSHSALKLRRDAEMLSAALPPLLVEAERVAATVAQGLHGRRRVGMGETFWQFRRYRAGDPAQRIDWRQSARSQHLFVRETEWEAAESVWLWCDLSASMAYRSDWSTRTKLARAQLLTLALAALLIRGGERVANLNGTHPPSASRLGLKRLALELLTGAPSGGAAASLPGARVLPRFSRVVLISDFLAPVTDLGGAIEHFAAQGVRGHLVQVLDPAEEDLPFVGRTRFEGVEERLTLTFGRAEALRDGYHAAVLAHREALAARARRLGFSFAHHRTDHAPHTALLALYGVLSAARDPARGPVSGRPASGTVASGSTR